MSHYRGDIEEEERLIAEYLNEQNPPIRKSSRMAGQIAKQVANKYKGTVESARHIGNTYDSIGDTELHVDGVPNYIELKILDNEPSNFGTLSNNSPTVPIQAGLFDGDPIEWKTFLNNHNHTDKVIGYLNDFPNYPESVRNKCTTDLNTKKHLGRYIRDLVANKTNKDFDPEQTDEINFGYTVEELREIATRIKTDIEDFDRKTKIQYIKYLSDFSVNPSSVKAYTIILVAGYHKKKQVLNYVDVVDRVVEEYGFSDVGEVFENYEVFYAYKNENDAKPTVKRDQRSRVIDKLCKIPSNEYEIRFGGKGNGVDSTGFSIGVTDNGEFEPLIRLALHWGNVFQGIATRRFNCFKQNRLNKLA